MTRPKQEGQKSEKAGAKKNSATPVVKTEQQRLLRCIDLFAGAGGFSLAAQKVGINVVAAIELNKRACDTYRLNFIEKPVVPGSAPVLYGENVLDLSPEIIRGSHFSRDEPCDVVLGGPPCQGFSVHRIKGAGVGDPRNELIFRYFAFVKALKPKVFLMENVPGLLWPRHKEFLDEFLKQSKEAGYQILGPERLDARDYGVPQRRVRVFVLGVRKGVAFDKSVWPPKPTHGNAKAQQGNLFLAPWVSAQTVFDMPDVEDDENNVHMNHCEALVEVFRNTPINGGSRRDSSRVLPCHKEHDGHSDVYGRIDPSEPAPTMTTACINPSKGRFVHPTEHHGITVRQAARFQTFPDNFIFKGGLMAAGEQIGNAVPIRLGEVLLHAVLAGLKNARKQ